MRYAAATVPGLGAVLAGELRAVEAVRSPRVVGSDGRSDLVAFDGRGGPWDLRVAEDVFAVVAEVDAPGSAAEAAEALWDERGVERSLSAFAAWRRPLAGRMPFHVVARLQDERRFRRTQLREAVAAVVRARKPKWVRSDPADLELWVWEAPPGRLTLAVRVTTVDQRQRGGRAVERPGALRPAVAAAMVRTAGPRPAGSPLLVDPCCGSGTVLAEATAAGWRAAGGDVDPAAVAAAVANGHRAVWLGDARRLPVGRASAVVANLPFGRRHVAVGDPSTWLDELRRLVPGERLVVLAPEEALGRPAGELGLHRRLDLRVLGAPATVWAGSAGPDGQ